MKRRLLLRTGFLLFLLFVITIAVASLFLRERTLKSSEETAHIIAEIVRDSLTSYMVLGIMDKRDTLLEQLKETQGLEQLRVVRGEAVVKQFGPGMEKEVPADRLEKEVLEKGEEKTELVETLDKVLYRLVIPYKASQVGKVNCMMCHKAREGEVLGAVSLAMDLTQKRKEATVFLGVYTLVVGGIFLSLLLITDRFFSLYSKAFEEIRRALISFKEGDFRKRVEVDLKDEVGELGGVVNEVGGALGETLSKVRTKVSMLLGYNVLETENALKDTEKIIEELVKIYNFKRTIEKDVSKGDIYSRLERILSDYMSLDKFSIYEVDERNNRIKPIVAYGEDMWCSENILENANECRAKRTGQDVDSGEFPCICPSFIHNDLCSEGKIQYYCIPVNVGGKVGNVVQIVYEREMDTFVRMIVPYIKGYLQEISPVLESRNLTELLKQQSYIDQLTGLYNRRFLEEIASKISAQILRRGTNLGILMVDVDYFKEVNDRYGHDVGDVVLSEVAKTIKNCVRESDFVIRFGGEEILVLLMDVKEGFAEKVAEKIRSAVESKVIEYKGGILKKTVSVGVSEFPKDCDGKLWRCVKFADIALYKAKEGGRNRVVRFTPEMWEGEGY